MYQVVFTKQAMKDRQRIKEAGLQDRAKHLLDVLSKDPFQNPPSYEKLVGDLAGFYSRRINLQHRLVYSVHPEKHIVKVLRMWTHYE